jgi:hypothetical protein
MQQSCEFKGMSHFCCFIALLPVVPFIATQKIVSQICPKRLKIVYFCPKSTLFELFELFDINLSNND